MGPNETAMTCSELGTLDHHTSIDDEFDGAVQHAAFIDRSSYGRIEVTGADRLDLLHRLSTNDLLAAKPGQVVGTVFTTEKGKVLDYVQVLMRNSSLLLLTSSENEETFKNWIQKYTIMEDITLKSITSSTTMYSFFGPKAAEVVGNIFDIRLSMGSVIDTNSPLGSVTIACKQEFNTEFVVVICSTNELSQSRTYLSKQAERHGVVEMGSMSYEAFRITCGIPAGETEISSAFNPFEIGLRHAISFTKGCYIGQEVIARLDTYQKVHRELMGLIFESKPDLHLPSPILNREGIEIGVATSCAETPVHTRFVGLGVLKRDLSKENGVFQIRNHGSLINCTVSQIPIHI